MKRITAVHFQICIRTLLCLGIFLTANESRAQGKINAVRERVSLNEGWRFMRYSGDPDSLFYDERPTVVKRNDNIVADTRATDTTRTLSSGRSLKAWILPTANAFIVDSTKHHKRPAGNPGAGFAFVQTSFNDGSWEKVNLPHDWAIKGPFYGGPDAEVGGGMGRLPTHGVAWYRRKLDLPARDKGKSIYLEIDGAMSYAAVWCNGVLVGGWPYGYNSFRLDLTPHLQFGKKNTLAIRIDNPNHSSRWYTGGGLYRNVWLTKTSPVQVGHWGTFVRTQNVSSASASVDIAVQVANKSGAMQATRVETSVFLLDKNGMKKGKAVAQFPPETIQVPAGQARRVDKTVNINNPSLWGPSPLQTPNLYLAVTRLWVAGKLVDEYETTFGIRSLEFHPQNGLLVNGQQVRIQGVNQHHDLGALGAAFNTRAAERQLEILREMGCNAIRMAHNPPAPELLDLCDKMGFLVIDEIYDNWERGKTPLDFHLVFADWQEADLRSFIRRDRNHPSVIAWSFGNEVGEQYTGEEGAALAKKLYAIVKSEDPDRPATVSMNYAKPDMPLPKVTDIISLNYQGEGIRDAPAYSHLKGIRTSPLYPAFQKAFPDKLIVSSESASALSTRGTYLFPVYNGISAPVSDSTGGDPVAQQVSAYELYTSAFGSSADKVFASQDRNPYVAGEFVWSGWDYLGEPTPYYIARSSYSGIIDLAGFKKNRFYLYQSRWRPELPMAHILPHWNWQGREGEITPVHVFTSGDEAELFLNGRSLGRQKKEAFAYRLRWDSVRYQRGELKLIAYKAGKLWAEQTVKTTGKAVQLAISADRRRIKADGYDLSFITVSAVDENGLAVPDASHAVRFTIEGPGEIIATDNGDPASLVSFASAGREMYSGLVLAIVRTKKGKQGNIRIKAAAPGLKDASLAISSR